VYPLESNGLVLTQMCAIFAILTKAKLATRGVPLMSVKKNSRLRRWTKKTPDSIVSRGALSNGVLFDFSESLCGAKTKGTGIEPGARNLSDSR
jgi:hypothetical protein